MATLAADSGLNLGLPYVSAPAPAKATR